MPNPMGDHQNITERNEAFDQMMKMVKEETQKVLDMLERQSHEKFNQSIDIALEKSHDNPELMYVVFASAFGIINDYFDMCHGALVSLRLFLPEEYKDDE